MKVAALIEFLLQSAARAAQVAALIKRARDEGRDEISTEDLQAVVGEDDAARLQLVDAINRAEMEGR